MVTILAMWTNVKAHPIVGPLPTDVQEGTGSASKMRLEIGS